MKNLKLFLSFILLLTGLSQAGYIKPVLEPFWDNPNVGFAKNLTITFSLESVLPNRGVLKVSFPTGSFFSELTSGTCYVYWKV